MQDGGGTSSPTRGARARRRRSVLGATILAVALVGPLAGPSAAVDTDMSIDITAVDFGSIAVGASSATVSVTLTNTGGDPFGPINIFGGAPPTAEFGASQSCQAVTLPAGGSCTVNYTFVPGAEGSYSDTSSFTVSETASQSDGEDFSVTLAGVGGSPPTTTASTDTPTTTAPPPPDEMGGEGSVAGGGEPATDDSSAPGGTTLPGAEAAAAESDDDGSDNNLLLIGLVAALVAGGAYFIGRARRPAPEPPKHERPPDDGGPPQP